MPSTPAPTSTSVSPSALPRSPGAWLAVTCAVVLGIIPSFLLFVWVERNMALPWLGPWIMQNLGPFGSWPLIYVDGGAVGPSGLGLPLLWNVGLVGFFGLVHSGLAGRAPRAAYVTATGLASIAILTLWQPTGIVLFQLIPSATVSAVVSVTLFWSLHLMAAIAIGRLEPMPRFLGLVAPGRPDATSDTLRIEGWYARMRHPAYTFTLLAWLATPMLSLDRLVFALAMAGYLVVGIRLEERRLVAKFGDAYQQYRKRVPMLVPRLINK